MADEARAGPPPADFREPGAGLRAWFDGACEPVNPGGVGTWGFVVRGDGVHIASESGVVPAAESEPITNNVAEYHGLLRLLGFLGAERSHEDVVIHGDSLLVIRQMKGEWKVEAPHLRRLRDLCRHEAEALGKVEYIHVPRERNTEADRLTHDAYVAAMESDSALAGRFASMLASPQQLAACRAKGIPVHSFMGRREATRLLERAEPKAESKPERNPTPQPELNPEPNAEPNSDSTEIHPPTGPKGRP